MLRRMKTGSLLVSTLALLVAACGATGASLPKEDSESSGSVGSGTDSGPASGSGGNSSGVGSSSSSGSGGKIPGDGPDDPNDGAGAGSQEDCTAADAGSFSFERIAVWKDDATAAYSMIHDDMCGFALSGIHQIAVPSLDSYNLTAALGPIVEECEKQGWWNEVTDAENRGNEIVNHSYTHPEISVSNAPQEVADAKTAFDMHVQNPISFYVFPYDYWTSQTLAKVAEAGHIGARAGNRDDNDGFENPPINSNEPGVDMEIEFDVWPRTYSKYALYTAENMLKIHVFKAIDVAGWAVREFHSVIEDGGSMTGSGFGPIEKSDYETHLDFLKKAWTSNKVWTSTPSRIIRYRHARKKCTASVSGDTISYGTSASDCTKFATPISVIVKTDNDVSSLRAKQGADYVETRKIDANTYSVTADPTLGAVTMEGCSNDGLIPDVDKSVDIGPPPEPANTVCDLEQVVGTGSPGMMDDLERPEDEFQMLPNPSQGDGRTGSWSWYPQNVTVEMAKESSNTVLHYAGSGVNAWTGVTLAFLGGNGAGSCYDASAYSGLKFKIKGSVSSSTMNNQVILSIVTAETQTKTFGGDLDGTGGHFNKVIPVTSSWQTVQVAWSELGKPTWGDTTSLSSVAVGKLQAIDWGVVNNASNFDISLDDIELY